MVVISLFFPVATRHGYRGAGNLTSDAGVDNGGAHKPSPSHVQGSRGDRQCCRESSRGARIRSSKPSIHRTHCQGITAAIPLGAPRMNLKPVKLAGYTIPGGCKVLVNIWAIGRDSARWSDSEAFQPERFLGSSGTIPVNGQNFD
ncbi:trans-cinnamate 4-monooxygenase-like [Selaginella moellendorffii]|uniref:trans-cinnamate 4-monooxygenase-like n=1 Tax=Selaginella moellendorffii TaxID=88036 RepID=UPI000D1C7348|nr:trans-cinnamate 4-monooxygenase-like [Selaginella moellendorffii]|eukprot:XP_024534407.1 trans-cinnamate 4-monooxygenase-like [Selaginella moellendorffii]